jgi:hypothetical protein
MSVMTAKDLTSILKSMLLMVVIGQVVAGCAGTATGRDTSVLKHDETVVINDVSRSTADALVVIRYPAIIDSEAERVFYHAYGATAIGGAVPVEIQIRNDTDRIAQSVIAKSNYFAMSLFHELQKNLPENSVLLSPHIIVMHEDGEVTSRPLLASEEIPSVLTIDFNVYSYPDTSKIMDSQPLTFGDIVTPLFVVHSNRWLRPSTHGLFLSSGPLMGSAWQQSLDQAQAQFDSRLLYQPENYQRPLDFITFLRDGHRSQGNLPVKSVGESRRDVIAVETYPIEKIRMQGELIVGLAEDYRVDPFVQEFVNGAASRVLNALNEVDHDRATFFARQHALARFDPELANAFLARSTSESVRARLQLAEALIEAERKFLSAQSHSIYGGTFEGDYGQKMRKMLVAEYRMLEERRRLARLQNMTTALAAVALAGSVYGTMGAGGATAAAIGNLVPVLVVGAGWATSKSIKTSRKSTKVTENFMAQMAPALDRQIDVQMEWLESKERITALGFAEFRNKTLTLYQSRVRSIRDTDIGECDFFHPAFETTGRWYGGCEDGLANSRGYGLIRDQFGETVEFVGTARDGRASGTGSMIAWNSNRPGAVYYEGQFKNGVPEGVLLLEEPGKRPRVREFRAGVDVGTGNAERLQSLSF